jgi:hypothetical protein
MRYTEIPKIGGIGYYQRESSDRREDKIQKLTGLGTSALVLYVFGFLIPLKLRKLLEERKVNSYLEN